jgi:hypothetical protein
MSLSNETKFQAIEIELKWVTYSLSWWYLLIGEWGVSLSGIEGEL